MFRASGLEVIHLFELFRVQHTDGAIVGSVADLSWRDFEWLVKIVMRYMV